MACPEPITFSAPPGWASGCRLAPWLCPLQPGFYSQPLTLASILAASSSPVTLPAGCASSLTEGASPWYLAQLGPGPLRSARIRTLTNGTRPSAVPRMSGSFSGCWNEHPPRLPC